MKKSLTLFILFLFFVANETLYSVGCRGLGDIMKLRISTIIRNNNVSIIMDKNYFNNAKYISKDLKISKDAYVIYMMDVYVNEYPQEEVWNEFIASNGESLTWFEYIDRACEVLNVERSEIIDYLVNIAEGA